MTKLVLTLFTLLLVQMYDSQAQQLSEISLIPKPCEVVNQAGSYTFSSKSIIYYDGQNQELKSIAQFFATKISVPMGYKPATQPLKGTSASKGIILRLESTPEIGEEGYVLSITRDAITLSANKPVGVFNGVQTIRQLLPATIEANTKQSGPWIIPGGIIKDYPEYGYRGVMLDVARHFFKVDDVKRYIDQIASFKMNVMHLHLSDDQGWRIEIKKWPKLTEIGGSTQVGGGKGGFYTQEQYKELVRYAAERYITIVPEIDMPGHTNAALASYPELNCNGKATELYTGTEVGFSSLCTGKDITYQFIKDVFTELAEITPGKYIHIGGDESHATKIEDYIPFVNQVQTIVTKLGKQVIGWDEIALSTLQPNTTVHYWAKSENAKKGVAQGAKVLISPAAKAYLDMQYDKTTPLGLHWAGYIEIDTGYNWDPATLVPEITKAQILGIEAPIWSETIATRSDLEYMVYPRLPGYAEIGWTSPALRNWDDYKSRLGRFDVRFKAAGINYYPSKMIPWSVPLER